MAQKPTEDAIAKYLAAGVVDLSQPKPPANRPPQHGGARESVVRNRKKKGDSKPKQPRGGNIMYVVLVRKTISLTEEERYYNPVYGVRYIDNYYVAGHQPKPVPIFKDVDSREAHVDIHALKNWGNGQFILEATIHRLSNWRTDTNIEAVGKIESSRVTFKGTTLFRRIDTKREGAALYIRAGGTRSHDQAVLSALGLPHYYPPIEDYLNWYFGAATSRVPYVPGTPFGTLADQSHPYNVVFPREGPVRYDYIDERIVKVRVDGTIGLSLTTIIQNGTLVTDPEGWTSDYYTLGYLGWRDGVYSISGEVCGSNPYWKAPRSDLDIFGNGFRIESIGSSYTPDEYIAHTIDGPKTSAKQKTSALFGDLIFKNDRPLTEASTPFYSSIALGPFPSPSNKQSLYVHKAIADDAVPELVFKHSKGVTRIPFKMQPVKAPAGVRPRAIPDDFANYFINNASPAYMGTLWGSDDDHSLVWLNQATRFNLQAIPDSWVWLGAKGLIKEELGSYKNLLNQVAALDVFESSVFRVLSDRLMEPRRITNLPVQPFPSPILYQTNIPVTVHQGKIVPQYVLVPKAGTQKKPFKVIVEEYNADLKLVRKGYAQVYPFLPPTQAQKSTSPQYNGVKKYMNPFLMQDAGVHWFIDHYTYCKRPVRYKIKKDPKDKLGTI